MEKGRQLQSVMNNADFIQQCIRCDLHNNGRKVDSMSCATNVFLISLVKAVKTISPLEPELINVLSYLISWPLGDLQLLMLCKYIVFSHSIDLILSAPACKQFVSHQNYLVL
jgi:hypothetical protein